ncbi:MULTISPECIES: phage tail tape measure protein [Enterobacteriaceae]|uniref:phage tail tape measure protein n=1 Tax=Enterobacteriaceae TaxID=543 RepID=UPI00044F8915|nr:MULTISPECIES: phage tail tape measure protein [Enterobacteriaceae]DAH65688.1 MAG TPA: minor tail protein [Caudoviricetes sp.]AKZ72815.1 phage tail protein [Enterobacter roggenkampii]EKY3989118.1 phage tail tape measure protein [Enterobacter roggenkampii]EUL60759.1 phage tail tape measure protein, TP901 family, core region [Enterobacter roggenkampii UCI 39]KJN61125.1 tail protein [Enterobacter roggenkampii]
MATFELKALITGVDKLSPALSSMQKKIKGFQKGIKSSGLADFSVGDLIGGGALAAPFIAGAKAAIDFESQMADVRKVVDFDTPKQFAEMGEDILKMSDRLPMAASDIAKLVAAGGQAGIARQDLRQFAEDALKMGVAFDQSADQSGDMMAKWRTSFKMTQGEVVALADKINYLSNNGAANAQQISDIVTRIGPLGSIAGVTSGQIAALGATMAGVGVEQEVAATGIKNFMIALTAGKSATKQQQAGLKELGLSSTKLAASMQKDAQGTMLTVLQQISRLDKTRQVAAFNVLFGKESMGAIAPLLANLDLLKKNFNMVGDASQYTGSMQKEYEARAATTANQLQLLSNQATHAGVALGNALLPQINASARGMMPLINKVTDYISRNPGMVRALLGAAVGFATLRLAAMGASAALKVMSFVATASPVGLIVRGIALAAGLIIANWDAIGPYFKKLWDTIGPYFNAGWELFKKVFSWTPLGMVINNWGPVVKWFQDMWDKLKPIIEWFSDGASDTVAAANAAQWGAGGYGAYGAGVASSGYNPYQIKQASAQPQGKVTVQFENAPPGMKVTETRASGIDVNHDVGYTRIGRTGMGG